MSKIHVASMRRVSHFLKDTEEAPAEFKDLLRLQWALIRKNGWVELYKEVYLSYNLADVLGVFVIEFSKPMNNGADTCVWTVVGDLPDAYIVVDLAPDYRAALSIYCELMQGWIEAVRSGRGITDEIYPVEVIQNRENAEALANRVAFIRNEILRSHIDDPSN